VGGEISGREALERLTTQAERSRAAMEERLPVGTHSDWVAIGGVDLFSEYELRKHPAIDSTPLDLVQVLCRTAPLDR
jgi:hypothetical protein